MRALLAKADLVSVGFTKTEETHIVTGEDGKQQKKLVISYTVQDACSNVSFWEETIRVRLPIFSKRLTRKVISEVEKRIDNRTTEYCRFGMEVHITPYSHAGKEKEKERRRLSAKPHCRCCCKTDIKYTPVNQGAYI
jgi:hypothetical protein